MANRSILHINMRYGNKNYRVEASQLWKEGRSVEAGRLLSEKLAPYRRPGWAGRILALLTQRAGIESSPIGRIIKIAVNPREWRTAHHAFSEARHSTLELDAKLRTEGNLTGEERLLHALLALAELVAKVAYNATNPNDEFDEDSGWWIAGCTRDVLDRLKDDGFSTYVWSVMCNQDDLASGAPRTESHGEPHR